MPGIDGAVRGRAIGIDHVELIFLAAAEQTQRITLENGAGLQRHAAKAHLQRAIARQSAGRAVMKVMPERVSSTALKAPTESHATRRGLSRCALLRMKIAP